MTLQSSGAISIANINTELGSSGTLSLNDVNVRNLARITSGTISLSNLYSKSANGSFFITVNNNVTTYIATSGTVNQGVLYVVANNEILLFNQLGVLQWQKSCNITGTITCLCTGYSNQLFIGIQNGANTNIIRINSDGSTVFNITLNSFSISGIAASNNIGTEYLGVVGTTSAQGAGGNDAVAICYSASTGGIQYQRSLGNANDQIGGACSVSSTMAMTITLTSQYTTGGPYIVTIVNLTATGTTNGTIYSSPVNINTTKEMLRGNHYIGGQYTNVDGGLSWKFAKLDNAANFSFGIDSGTLWDGTASPQYQFLDFDNNLSNSYLLVRNGLTGYHEIIKLDSTGTIIYKRTLTSSNLSSFYLYQIDSFGENSILVLSGKSGTNSIIIRLAADGSGTGTFTDGTYTYTYSAGSTSGFTTLTSGARSTRTLTNGARTLTAGTSSITTAASSYVITKYVI